MICWIVWDCVQEFKDVVLKLLKKSVHLVFVFSMWDTASLSILNSSPENILLAFSGSNYYYKHISRTQYVT